MQSLFTFEEGKVNPCSCPRCGNSIPSADVNVSADTALCRKCGCASRFSELLESGRWLSHDLSSPPNGASFRQEGSGFVASATTRSAYAWFLVPFMCVWSGMSLGGIYGSQFMKGQFDIWSSLFGIPFVSGTLLFGIQAIMAACGRVVIARDGDKGVVFEGVGPLGWSRKFNWRDVSSVTDGEASWGPARNRKPHRVIIISFRAGPRDTLRFGMLLSEERRWFLQSVLRNSR